MKWIVYSYFATWDALRVYPRFWFSKTKNPNFKYTGYIIRWGWWYFGFQKGDK